MVKARNGSTSVSQREPPGGTFRICSSSRLTELDAHYRAIGASNLKVRLIWKVTAQPANSEPGRLFPEGYFYVANPNGLPDGTWSVRVVRHGKTLGRSSLTIAKEHC